MERKESSSSVENIDDDKEENIDSVTAMTTPFRPTAIKLHASTLRKMKEQDEWIKLQQKQIEELTFNLTIKVPGFVLVVVPTPEALSTLRTPNLWVRFLADGLRCAMSF